MIRHHMPMRIGEGKSTQDGGDLLALMLGVQKEQQQGCAQGGIDSREVFLSAHEVEDNCMALFLAGHETSATALTWWMGHMAQHPQHAERAREQIAAVMGGHWHQTGAVDLEQLSRLDFLEATIKESMRLCPPIVTGFNRQVAANTQLHGIHIRRGDLVLPSIWHLHHDPRWYPEPEQFNPERFLPGSAKTIRGAWLAFGAGPHVCIGQHFALLEMKIVAALLLSKIRWGFLPEEALPQPTLNIVLKPAKSMRL